MAACDPPDDPAKNFYCRLCGKETDDLETHSQNTHKFTSTSIDCFNNLEDLCLMLRDLDVQDQPNICPFCNETNEDLDNHIITEHKISEWDCPICGDKITYQIAKIGQHCCAESQEKGASADPQQAGPQVDQIENVSSSDSEESDESSDSDEQEAMLPPQLQAAQAFFANLFQQVPVENIIPPVAVNQNNDDGEVLDIMINIPDPPPSPKDGA